MDARSAEESYHELCAYTLSLGDAAFRHQHVVDAQAADEATKPIKLTFGLVGLCLLLEHGWNGREVQQAHMDLAKQRKDWPRFPLPEERGAMTAVDVLAQPEGEARNAAIVEWCREVWGAYGECHGAVAALLRAQGLLPR